MTSPALRGCSRHKAARQPTSPSSPQFSDNAGFIGRRLYLDVGQRGANLVRNARRLQSVQQQTALAVDQGRDRAGKDSSAGLASTPPQLPE